MSQKTPEAFIADNQNPETRCAGGFGFDECDTALALMKLTERFRSDRKRFAGDGRHNHLVMPEFMLGCVACRKICHLARRIQNCKPTPDAIIICDDPV